MAEQLRYEQQFKGLDIPNVDFAAEREISKGYAQMSAKLDQMSNFFMKQAEGMAKIEGAEYGAANAPTKQQIEDAKALCLLYTSPSPRDGLLSRMPSSA